MQQLMPVSELHVQKYQAIINVRTGDMKGSLASYTCAA
jgi:hypothetical protein